MFEYSEALKSQTGLAPLIDFPNKNKVYKSQTLFPFFMSHIPSLKQPKVQAVIEADTLTQPANWHCWSVLAKRRLLIRLCFQSEARRTERIEVEISLEHERRVWGSPFCFLSDNFFSNKKTYFLLKSSASLAFASLLMLLIFLTSSLSVGLSLVGFWFLLQALIAPA